LWFLIFFCSFFLCKIVFPLLPWVFSFMELHGRSFYCYVPVSKCCRTVSRVLASQARELAHETAEWWSKASI
jgi:hypothetical protein